MAGRSSGEIVGRSDFAALLADVKQRIQSAQTRAMLAVNAELVRLYWDIGRIIDGRQQREGWGAAVIPRLALALKNELPELKGFSERNIKRMLAFYREYTDPFMLPPQPPGKRATAGKVPQPAAQLDTTSKVPQVAAQLADSFLWAIPWFHHVILMEKVKDISTRCNIVNDRLKHPTDQPTIGLILCQQHNQLLAEYSFAGINKPIGISTYELTRALPQGLRSALPTVEQIETELSDTVKRRQPSARRSRITHRKAK